MRMRSLIRQAQSLPRRKFISASLIGTYYPAIMPISNLDLSRYEYAISAIQRFGSASALRSVFDVGCGDGRLKGAVEGAGFVWRGFDLKPVSASMTRRYGRAPRGQRCLGSAPHGHWKTTTFVGALRHNRPTAPMVSDQPMDGEMFLAWVRQFLVPTLQPRDVVILDNLSSHKVKGVREAITAVGATVLYLPPYSPDLNPIEKLFAKLKALLRRAAKRSVDELWIEIGRLLDTIAPGECSNYFASSGYVCN